MKARKKGSRKEKEDGKVERTKGRRKGGKQSIYS
jgi:hypothetical protein